LRLKVTLAKIHDLPAPRIGREVAMPQLVKGGKYVFGWTLVHAAGRIVIPPEALAEYGLRESEKLVVLPGSRTSGGFILGSREKLRRSPIGGVLDARPALFDVHEGAVVEFKGKPFAWARLRRGGIVLPGETLARYGVRPGDRLLVVRGSGLAVSLIVRGPIVAFARTYSEIQAFGGA
jgi:bifunctional DNA-binding transcriptional regulator/antitoxin component of YhaV-PrlF toxin-antitoxin module